MDRELNSIRVKMKALGFSQRQIESIINECLRGSNREDMNSEEKNR